MPKIINTGYTDTANAAITHTTAPRAKLNFAADFKAKKSGDTELIITNVTSPLDRPESIRFGVTDIKNVYNGLDISVAVQAPSKKGTQILTQVTEVISVTDSVDAMYRIDLPVSAHLVIKVPNSEHITGEIVQTLVSRVISSLYVNTKDDTTRINSLLRGVLKPSEI